MFPTLFAQHVYEREAEVRFINVQTEAGYWSVKEMGS